MKNVLLFFATAACLLSGGCTKKDTQPGGAPQGGDDNTFDNQVCWSVVGSAGTIDGSSDSYVLGTPLGIFFPPETDPLPFNFLNLSSDGVASVRANIASANASIRFNIGNLSEQKPYGKVLQVRYLVSDKTKQRLLVIVKKYNLTAPPASEAAEVVKIFDSNGFPASANFQTQRVDMPKNEILGTFDFSAYAYYIEALLIRTGLEQTNPAQIPNPSAHAAPALGIISICDNIPAED